MEEAGGEGKAAGVEEAGPGRGCPCPAQVGDRVEHDSERLRKLLMKSFDKKCLCLLKKFRVEHELRKVRKTFDEKV